MRSLQRGAQLLGWRLDAAVHQGEQLVRVTSARDQRIENGAAGNAHNLRQDPALARISVNSPSESTSVATCVQPFCQPYGRKTLAQFRARRGGVPVANLHRHGCPRIWPGDSHDGRNER